MVKISEDDRSTTQMISTDQVLSTTSSTCCTPGDSLTSIHTTSIEGEDDSNQPGICFREVKCAIFRVYATYEFPINILLSMVVAKIYPPLGAIYLQPQITAKTIAVCLIFVIVGLGLKTKELTNAFRRLYFNTFVQVFNFCFVSAFVFVTTRVLTSLHILNDALADGMVICSCLPIAINALIVLTASTGGDEAVAVFNTCFSNLLGIFVSPLLILGYLGKRESVDVKDIFTSLGFIVVIPMLTGWLLQNYVPRARAVYAEHKRKFKRTQESCLVFIVYTVFCHKFLTDSDAASSSSTTGTEAPSHASLADVMVMIAIELALILSFMGISWTVLGMQFPNEPELRVTGLFACHHKTIALGVPLISSMYDRHPNVALYTLPILVWHPMQLVLGSFLVPTLASYIQTERKRLTPISEADAKPNEAASLLGLTTEEDRAYGTA